MVVGTTFLAEDFGPRMLFGTQGSANALANDEANDLTSFDGAYTFGGTTDQRRFENAAFQERCVPLWDAANPDDPVVDPASVEGDEPNHTLASDSPVEPLPSSRAAANEAGPTLNNDTLEAGLDRGRGVRAPRLRCRLPRSGQA